MAKKKTGAITFTELLTRATRSGHLYSSAKTALEFFRKEATKVTDVNASQVLKSADKKRLKAASRIVIGRMYLFAYDPKYKKELPYYDHYPLIFPIDWKEDGSFLGLNMHYLHPNARAKLMDALYELAIGKEDDKRKLAIGYSILKGVSKYKYFKPCIKHYLPNHIRSRMFEVPYGLWSTFLFLPLSEFSKKSAVHVWRESYKVASK